MKIIFFGYFRSPIESGISVADDGKRTDEQQKTLDHLRLSFLRKQESRVLVFLNGGERQDTGFPIKNVGNDRSKTKTKEQRQKLKTLDPRSEPVLDVCHRGSGMTDINDESVNAFVNHDHVQDKKAAA